MPQGLAALAILIATIYSSLAFAGPEIVLHTRNHSNLRGNWTWVADSAAASGGYLLNRDMGAAKVETASSAPADSFDMSFTAEAGVAYRVWFRMKAQNNHYANDSVFLQFSGSVDSSGAAIYRIGTSSGSPVILRECDQYSLSGWGWNNSNGWCGSQELIYFRTSGSQVLRVQAREDGVAIDQIVISAVTYRSAAPGAAVNDTRILAPNDGSGSVPDPTPTPAPTPAPVTSSSLKVITWNNGGGDESGEITQIVNLRPQVVFLQEVDSRTHFDRIRQALASSQGGTWHKYEILRGTDTTSSFVGIVSKYPLTNIQSVILRRPGTYVVSCYSSSAIRVAGRAALGAQITVNGRVLSLFSVRTTSESDRGCMRDEENRILKNFAWDYPAPRIYGGDFNMQPYDSETEYQTMLNWGEDVTDSWYEAVLSGRAFSFDNNPTRYTPTRSTRMDYVFYTRGTPYLSVTRSDIVDEGSLSDHRIVSTTFTVR
ncbi:MAG TPA: endonuclease/exonuclease/phosphatase family protein [Bdellovibrionales bacterium]|nr:endonuclease/exonuclease/phosphatase family protein [Bdellovibrionales bacterium]